MVDDKRQTVPVRVQAQRPDARLRPNAFVTVSFEARTNAAVQVPASALVSDGARSVMFVKSAQGGLERREVQPGRQAGGVVEILSGLEPGQVFVDKGGLLLENVIEMAD